MKNSEKSSKLNKLFFTFFFFFILSGCAPLKLSYKHPQSAPNALKALAKIETDGLKGRITIILKSPDLMRIEFYGPLSGIAGVVAGNGKNCFLYSNGVTKSCNRDEEGSIYPPSSSTAPPLNPPLNPEELVPILLGMEADLKDRTATRITKDKEGRVTEFIRFSWDGSVLVRVALKDYRDISGVYIPFGIVIEGKKRRFSIEYYSVELNPEIDNEIFTLPPPSTQ